MKSSSYPRQSSQTHLQQEMPKGWVKVPSKSHPGNLVLNKSRAKKPGTNRSQSMIKVKSKSRPGEYWYLQPRRDKNT